MVNIGGNTTATLQKRTSVKNALGQGIISYENVDTLTGYLDMATGSANYTSYNAKITESTHVFIADYKDIKVDEEEARMVINGRNYDVKYIDNPMGLNEHLEIFLKYIGGQ